METEPPRHESNLPGRHNRDPYRYIYLSAQAKILVLIFQEEAIFKSKVVSFKNLLLLKEVVDLGEGGLVPKRIQEVSA